MSKLSSLWNTFTTWLSGLWKKDNPAPKPNPKPKPTPEPAGSAQVKAAMFVDAAGSPFKETISNGVTSPQGWALCHGQSWENDYRIDILRRLKAAGSRWLVYIVDGAYRNAPVLAMCLADMQHPEDGRHMVSDEGWFDRSIAAGVDSHIAIFRDSPGSAVPITEQSVINLIAAYKGARWKEVIFLVGLETKRNTTAEQAAQIVQWFRAHCTHRVIVGDQSVDFLLDVANRCNADLWLEQPSHPTQQPLTSLTAGGYLDLLGKLAAAVGASKVWAGEWWAASKTDRQDITRRILSAGYHCGCGDFT